VIKVLDQMGREIILPKRPQRIVSLVPSQTELLIYLGLEEQLVGITKFCVHPKHLLKTKQIVGGTKNVHFDRVRDLQPDIILCNKEENTEAIVSEAMTIAPVHVSDVRTISQALTLMQQYGILFGKTPETNRLIATISIAQLHFQKKVKERPIKKVAYFIWRDPWMVAGKDTFIDTLLKINRFENVYGNTNERYPEVDISELKELDYVLLSSEPFPFAEKHIKEVLQYTDAQIILVDGEYFSWYGDRLVAAFDYFTDFQQLLMPAN